MIDPRLSGKYAVAGVGTSAYGKFPEKDDFHLAADAFADAIEDCGLDKSKIDGLAVCRVPHYAPMAEMIGLQPRWTLQLPPHGRMSGISIIEALAALDAGYCDYAVLLYANIGRSRRIQYGGEESPGFWDPWGFTSMGAIHAMLFREHMERYGTTTRQLAEVSVAFRKHAVMNPSAVMREAFTIDDHEAARMICDPLRLLDYCLINDGAVCLILTSVERAKDLKKKPVAIAGIGAQDALRHASYPQADFWFDALQKTADQVYPMASVGPSDIDALMVYDNFSPTVLFSLEGMGFCAPGEAGAFVEGGTLGLGGALPANTDGGHLSNSYMQGWALNVEAVRQVRGECGARQVPDCEVVQYVAATPCTRSIIYRPA
ncbi:thiolase family protein [Acuticoccus sp. M5D2P5]|uniref:thiolase family protein n=1 Tax=Acuticoccus kalidii TaxID=2910977 RepID=UPI001F1A382E|nr:thiolase family protein [Acuticoccus kalidii]MCF3935330.1 thiolase family protein [Acuticoccus kalidii]